MRGPPPTGRRWAGRGHRGRATTDVAETWIAGEAVQVEDGIAIAFRVARTSAPCWGLGAWGLGDETTTVDEGARFF
jgi:hypothetical protein